MNTNNETVKDTFREGLVDFIAGSLGGVAVVYVGQPLDTVKVKMQAFPSLYKGMADCFLRTLKNDGVVRGLYAGTIPAVVANVAENSVLFAAYGGCQQAIASALGIRKIEELDSVQKAWAGFFAAFFSSLTLCPTELVKCKLQAMREVESRKQKMRANIPKSKSCTGMTPRQTPKKGIGPYALTKQILREQGIRGLYTGLSSTMAREMPGYFFFFGGYEMTRQLLAKPGQSKDDIGWENTMIAGAVGGTLLWLIIFPADVVKSRIQVKNLKIPASVVMRDIARREGIGALYNGLKPTLIRTIPATAALFVTFEYSKKFLHLLYEKHHPNIHSL